MLSTRFFSRTLLYLLWLFAAGCCLKTVAAASDRDVAQRAAMWAARGEVVPCRMLYDSIVALRPEVRDSLLPPHVALFCRLSFARAEGDGVGVEGIVDTLETQFENRFDVRGLLALADVRLDAMYSAGRWKALEQYCRDRLQWCARRNIKASRRKVFRQYLAVAAENRDRPPSGILWHADSFSVTISRDWPLLIPVSAGGGHPLPFMLHSGQAHTIVSEADLKEWDISLLPTTPTVDIEVEGHATKAYVVVVDSLHIGGVTLTDIPVFAVGREVEPPYNRVVDRHPPEIPSDRRHGRPSDGPSRGINARCGNPLQPCHCKCRNPYGAHVPHYSRTHCRCLRPYYLHAGQYRKAILSGQRKR